jgi:hypothetical protein
VNFKTKSDIMNKLHNKLIIENIFVPKEGQRGLLCSNKESIRCPFLGINNNSEDVALDYLAKVLVEAFLDKQGYERNKSSR